MLARTATSRSHPSTRTCLHAQEALAHTLLQSNSCLHTHRDDIDFSDVRQLEALLGGGPKHSLIEQAKNDSLFALSEMDEEWLSAGLLTEELEGGQSLAQQLARAGGMQPGGAGGSAASLQGANLMATQGMGGLGLGAGGQGAGGMRPLAMGGQPQQQQQQQQLYKSFHTALRGQMYNQPVGGAGGPGGLPPLAQGQPAGMPGSAVPKSAAAALFGSVLGMDAEAMNMGGDPMMRQAGPGGAGAGQGFAGMRGPTPQRGAMPGAGATPGAVPPFARGPLSSGSGPLPAAGGFGQTPSARNSLDAGNLHLKLQDMQLQPDSPQAMFSQQGSPFNQQSPFNQVCGLAFSVSLDSQGRSGGGGGGGCMRACITALPCAAQMSFMF